MQVKEQVKEALAQRPGQYFSGSKLAQQLNVSRNAVWKAIQALQKEGIAISSHPRFGYRLSEQADLITREAVQSQLTTRELGQNLLVLDRVDSTNTMVKQLAREGSGHGVTVIADQQTAGRGQNGRAFFSPAGTGLYMTVLLRLPIAVSAAQRLTICAAVATARAIDHLYGTHVQIKWVNDLYLNGKKICGILTEGSLSCEMGCLDYAVLGIGVNVRQTQQQFPEELLPIVTSVEEVCGKVVPRSQLAAEILNQLEPLLPNPTAEEVLEEYRERSFLTGRKVSILQGGQARTAQVLGIDRKGRLVVQEEDGSRQALVSADRVLPLANA